MVFVCHFLPLSGIVIFPEISAEVKRFGLGFNKKLGEREWREGRNIAVVESLTCACSVNLKDIF